MQRKTVDIEKNAVRQARAHSYNISKPPGTNSSSGSGSGGGGGGTNGSNNSGSFFEDNFFNRKSNQSQQQTQMQEEIDLQALEEQERQIRELEVSETFTAENLKLTICGNLHHTGKYCGCK